MNPLIHKFWKRLVVLQAFCVFGTVVHGQDTLSLFYANGEYKLSPSNQAFLNEFVFGHDLKELDSVQVFGFTDVTGKIKQNMRLSKKRAQVVVDRIEELLPRRKPIRCIAMGEESDEDRHERNHRRVELILFGKNYALNSDRNEIRLTDLNHKRGTCYTVHDSIMMNCFVTPFKRGSSKYLKVHVAAHQVPKEQLYSFSGASLQVKPLKWKLEKLGTSWWHQQVYTTLVKEKDYYTYGLLVLRDTVIDPACGACEYDTISPNMRGSLSVDIAIMENMQIRYAPWRQKVRFYVPSEFVDVNQRYFFGNSTELPVYWFQKRGKEASLIYIAELDKSAYRRLGAQIYSPHQHCGDSVAHFIAKYAAKKIRPHGCAGQRENVLGRFRTGIELGAWNGTRTSFGVNLYVDYQYSRWIATLAAGTDVQLNLQNYLALNVILYSFVPFSEEVLDVNRPQVHDYHRPLLLYTGLGLSNQFAFRANQPLRILPELHAGIALQNNEYGFGLDRLFLEGGLGYQWDGNASKIAPYARIGIRFKI